MILTNLNRWVIVLYLRRWKEGKRVAHVSRAVPCATRTCHVYFRVENYVTCNEWRVCVRVRGEITASLLLYRVNVLPFLRIESTQLKR
jgi:hypothetical protein